MVVATPHAVHRGAADEVLNKTLLALIVGVVEDAFVSVELSARAWLEASEVVASLMLFIFSAVVAWVMCLVTGGAHDTIAAAIATSSATSRKLLMRAIAHDRRNALVWKHTREISITHARRPPPRRASFPAPCITAVRGGAQASPHPASPPSRGRIALHNISPPLSPLVRAYMRNLCISAPQIIENCFSFSTNFFLRIVVL